MIRGRRTEVMFFLVLSPQEEIIRVNVCCDLFRLDSRGKGEEEKLCFLLSMPISMHPYHHANTHPPSPIVRSPVDGGGSNLKLFGDL